MKMVKATEEELKELTLKGTRWRLRSGVMIHGEGDGREFTITPKHTLVIVEDDLEGSYVTGVFLDESGKALYLDCGCIEKWLVNHFEPIDLESCRDVLAAMRFLWDEKREGRWGDDDVE